MTIPTTKRLTASESESDALFRRLELLCDNVPTLIYLVDSNHRFLNVNKRWETLVGMPIDQVIGKSLYDIFPKETADQFAENNRLVLREGRMELEETHAGRTYISVKVAVPDENGRNYAICGFSTDITARKEIEDELRKSRAALEAADARKNLSLATLSHELRNPLGPILDSARYLLKRNGSDAEVRRTSEMILRNGERMQRMIEDLLDVSRAMHGRVDLQIKPFDLRQAVTDATRIVAGTVETRRQPLTVNLPARAMHVRGDDLRLTQIFTNLLQNASKFSPHGANIVVALRAVDRMAVLEVRDEGIGIEADALPHVFEPFWQAEDPGNRGGLGLGLFLSRSLAELHDGTIDVESDGSGKGSTFIVRLPLTT